MTNVILKMIKEKYPNYDTERYHFRFGDIVTLESGTVICVIASAIEYVEAVVTKRGFGHTAKGLDRIYFSELPYIFQGDYVRPNYTVQKSLKWEVGDIVYDSEYNNILILYREDLNRPQEFYGYVLNTDSKYYEQGVCVNNPYKCYMNGG